MAVLIDENAGVLCHGLIGSGSTARSGQAIARVAGGTRGNRPLRHLDLPAFNPLHEANRAVTFGAVSTMAAATG